MTVLIRGKKSDVERNGMREWGKVPQRLTEKKKKKSSGKRYGGSKNE